MGAKKSRFYAEQFKRSSALLASESSQPISKTANELGVPETTLHDWINKYYPNSEIVEPLNSQEAEIIRLKKELAEAKIECEILKKAAAYFAKEAV